MAYPDQQIAGEAGQHSPYQLTRATMPPFVPRKRQRSSTPAAYAPPPKRPKQTVFDAFDAPLRAPPASKDNKYALDPLSGEGDSDSSLSDVSSSDFEDVPLAGATSIRDVPDGSQSGSEEAEDMDWEDALPEKASTTVHAPTPQGDLEITLDGGATPGWTDAARSSKKGPTKIERQIRTYTHCMHVQFLLWHNALRNAWTCDGQVQKILVDGLTGQMEKEVQKWRAAAGPTALKTHGKGQSGNAATKNRRNGRKVDERKREQRDWGDEAAPLESNRADPLIRLLKYLAAYWKKKFRVTAPGLRRQGYKPLRVLEEKVKSFQKDEHEPEAHGERIRDLDEFRELARRCEGSRDVGAQLFVALLRGLGLTIRLVASLQPSGFGWSSIEDAPPKEDRKRVQEQQSHELGSDTPTKKEDRRTKKGGKGRKSKHVSRGGKHEPITLDESGSESGSDSSSDDEVSVIETSRHIGSKRALKQFDRDLRFPIYWTEVLSPATNTYIPVDALVLRTIGNSPDLLSAFEPRGKEADTTRQTMAYVIAYSADGSAKDVTVRYLKGHMWPGKTKGMRMSIEKIPVYNKRGKVKRYEEYDWFKTVISGYERRARNRSAADDIEDSTDLLPRKPAQKPKTQTETLQGYKNSAEFVLERHLRREEAILPHAKPVKTFTIGKGEKAKPAPVFRRKDVVACKTVESWHKEGKAVKVGEQPLKYVPMRAVTLLRKREVQETERHTGEKVLQGLYSAKQTEWIVPPPIKDGKIPRNVHNNMDVFVPSMIPKGAAHVRLNGCGRICKKLGIDYADACTGFEFSRQRAIPIITGVIVAVENREALIDAWNTEEANRQVKAEDKKVQEALNTWKKFLTGLRILRRMRHEYGGDESAHLPDQLNPFTSKKNKQPDAGKKNHPAKEPPHETEPEGVSNIDQSHDGADFAGGFLRDDSVEPEPPHDLSVTLESDHCEIPDSKAVIASSYPRTPISLGSGQDATEDERPLGLSESNKDRQDEHLKPKRPVSNGKKAHHERLPATSKPRDEDSDVSTTVQSRTIKQKQVKRAKRPAPSPTRDKLSTSPPPNSQRGVPKRRSARKSETATYSHYFHHSDDHDDEEESDASIAVTTRERVRRRTKR